MSCSLIPIPFYNLECSYTFYSLRFIHFSIRIYVIAVDHLIDGHESHRSVGIRVKVVPLSADFIPAGDQDAGGVGIKPAVIIRIEDPPCHHGSFMASFFRIEAVPVVINIIPAGNQIAIGTKIIRIALIFCPGGGKIGGISLIGKPPAVIVFFPGPI